MKIIKLEEFLVESIRQGITPYDQVIKEVAQWKVAEEFHDTMGGGKSLRPNLNDIIIVLFFVYNIPKAKIHQDIQDLMDAKEEDLKNHWEEAVKGTYDFKIK
jgi:hypothetical protein